MSKAFSLADFVRESNRIEHIFRVNIDSDVAAHAALLRLSELTIGALCDFVNTVAGVKPRFAQGMDVRVGPHLPPRGGPHIQPLLQDILDVTNNGRVSAWEGHNRYETLHPFMDGNGRSGRVIWLWHMGGIEHAPLGFLHTFYYQTLQERRL